MARHHHGISSATSRSVAFTVLGLPEGRRKLQIVLNEASVSEPVFKVRSIVECLLLVRGIFCVVDTTRRRGHRVGTYIVKSLVKCSCKGRTFLGIRNAGFVVLVNQFEATS